MFAADDEDGDFLSPTGGAKLASLFGLDQAASQGNESFQYTAPKQPRKSSGNSGPQSQKSAPPPNSPAVLFATAVHAYRYVNGQYVKQGKLGAAVLGNNTTKEYKILLYVSQQKQVTAARIHSGFILTVQPSNYCTFYDDQRQNWSLMFESEKAATDFCKEVCLAKVNCSGTLDSVVIQDLVLSEGQAVENGDSLEVAYTGWLLQNNTIGQMFDSNLNKDKLLRLKLGAGKVIKGWEEGMLNMRKGGKRLMVIPPSLAYGSQGVANRVPPDSTLVFEAEIRRVLHSHFHISTYFLPYFLTFEVVSEPPLRAKSNSLSEQLSNPDATKAKLISRMAKMGQPMLPFITGPASSPSQPDSSDSELEARFIFIRHSLRTSLQWTPVYPDSRNVAVHHHHSLYTSPPARHLQCKFSFMTLYALSVIPASALLPVTMATANPQPMMPGAIHAFQPVSQMYPTQTVPYQGTSDVTSFLMTEARQHNTEIRLAVGKVADKLDHLSSKIEDLQKQGSVSLGLSNVSMETAMIMHNIQRIIQVIDSELAGEQYVEQSNLMMEQRNDSLKNSSEQNQARILQAEQDKARLTEELASSTARVSELQLELSSQQQKAAALQTKLNSALQDSQQHSTHITTLEAQILELKETADRVQNQYKMEKQKRKEVEIKLNNMEEELQDMKTEKDSLERTLSERKRKWQLERQRCDEELEEVRRAGQQELDNLRSQLRKARTSTDQAAAEQLSQLQADLEQEWQFNTLKQSRESEEQLLLQQQDQKEELQALREKVKRVMNGVFQSLRGEFDLNETYTGSAVLRVLVSTIKNVTLQLLTKKQRSSSEHSEKEEEEEEEEENEEERETDAQPSREVHINGQREEEEQRETDSAGQDEDGQLQVEKKDVSVAEEKKEETEEFESEEDRSEQQVVEEKSEEKVVEEKEVEVTEHRVKDQEISESGTETKREEKTESAETKHEDEAESVITSKQDVTTEPPEDVNPTREVRVIDESVTGPLDEPESTYTTLGGPPKNPPPPPPALQDETSDTSAPLSSLSERVEEENGEEPFFQSPTPSQPPVSTPAATPAEEEEEELVSRDLTHAYTHTHSTTIYCSSAFHSHKLII
ncbi:FK506-binding protein 15 [Labeo rohita]|uniref:peptidylprolyl isomerase n=1 Tax=Labeo rohita TaxID=84645 RepID=A0ABQ8MGQ1_LABRO|nr:FK506-binding protein 15 [Labeo rohita]